MIEEGSKENSSSFMNSYPTQSAFALPKTSVQPKYPHPLQPSGHQNSALAYLNPDSNCVRDPDTQINHYQPNFALSQGHQQPLRAFYPRQDSECVLSPTSVLSDVPIADRVKRNNRGSRYDRSNEGSEKNAPHSQDSVAESVQKDGQVHQSNPKPFEYQCQNSRISLNESSALLDAEESSISQLQLAASASAPFQSRFEQFNRQDPANAQQFTRPQVKPPKNHMQARQRTTRHQQPTRAQNTNLVKDISPQSVEPSTRANRKSEEGIPKYQQIDSKKGQRRSPDSKLLEDESNEKQLPCLQPQIMSCSMTHYNRVHVPPPDPKI